MRYNDKWDGMILPILQDTDYELVGVLKKGEGRNSVIRVYLDKPGGITIDEIATLSREINLVLSVELDMDNHTLEVSSPGINRQLFKPTHFQQQIGKEVRLKLNTLINNRRNFVGKIVAATDESATIAFESEEYTFQYSEIDEARLVLDITCQGHKKEAHNEQ